MVISMKILMRASQSPFDNIGPLDTIAGDKLWNNIGNLLFPFSLFRNILSEDVTIDIYSVLDPADADFISENYDMLLIPLANAFRSSFIKRLRKWTELIKKVTIPCVVAGVGIQSDLSFSPQTEFDFDDTVREFCSAVASKSSFIGVRGELTYSYLKRLGFGSVTRIIGCPSMFMFGPELPAPKPKTHAPKLKISVNMKSEDSDDAKKYLLSDDNDYIFIPSKNSDLALIYCGMPIPAASECGIYPLTIDNKVFTSGRAKFCINVPSWLKLLQSVDLSIGTLIHGNMAAVLAGTPVYVIASDSRVLELAQYHNIPHITEDKFNFSKSVRDIYEETDFSTVTKGHKERYENFIDFLKVNGLDPVEDPNRYFDDKLNSIDFYKPLDNILKVSETEAAQRLNGYLSHLQGKIKEQKQTIKKLKKKTVSQQAPENERK